MRIVTTGHAEQVGEDIANGKTVIVQNLKSLSNKRIGDLGEGYAIGELKKAGYDHVVQIQNASGHGVDIIAHNSSTDEVRVIEVKTTTGDKAPGCLNIKGRRARRSIPGNVWIWRKKVGTHRRPPKRRPKTRKNGLIRRKPQANSTTRCSRSISARETTG